MPPRESSKILHDCRDLAISRLTISFAQMMDRVGELLMDRANKSDIREEQQLYLDARHALRGERPALMAEFEKQLRRTINDRIARLNNEISKGSAVYSQDELRYLNKELEQYKTMHDYIDRNAPQGGY